jgi:hypothetical protein
VSIFRPHQMIFGNCVAKMKLVEQLTLITLQTAHHGSTSPRFASAQRNHGSRPVSTDFCNKIDPKQTLLNYVAVTGRRATRGATTAAPRDLLTTAAVYLWA